MGNLRQTVRTLTRRPLFAAAVILTFALCIGANTAILSVANSVLLSPLPYHDSDSLVSIREWNPVEGGGQETVSHSTFLDCSRGRYWAHGLYRLFIFHNEDSQRTARRILVA